MTISDRKVQTEAVLKDRAINYSSATRYYWPTNAVGKYQFGSQAKEVIWVRVVMDSGHVTREGMYSDEEEEDMGMGICTMKAGFAGDDAPRAVFPSIVGDLVIGAYHKYCIGQWRWRDPHCANI